MISFNLSAQNGLMQIGARPAAMGYAYATEADQWSFFHNPGGLGQLESEYAAFFALENKYGIEGLNIMGAGIISPVPVGTVAFGAFRFGDDFYNEQSLSLAYGNQFGIASLGLKANLLQYNIEGFGTKSVLTLDFGGTATVTKELVFGAYIRNINQAKVESSGEERVPTILNAGISYRPLDKLRLNIETEKAIEYDASLRVGLEYLILEKLAVRTGVSTAPFTSYGGLGFTKGRLSVDYAITKNTSLGYSHQGAVSFRIKQEK
ncbi:hypothetical protein E1176_06375 [Fulvivirga sp. RKSG066]|nr:hypothetical protein [Fulvivirga aurantia]